jgi:solute carrier family 45, member 1/2/4
MLIPSRRVAEEDDGPIKTLKQLFSTARHLPRRIQAICWVQFWSWIGKSTLPLGDRR